MQGVPHFRKMTFFDFSKIGGGVGHFQKKT